MTISKDLFLAILAMDSYNRGYDAGIKDDGDSDPDGLGDATGTQIGNARVVRASSSGSDSAEVAAGFYAIAYHLDSTSGLTNRTFGAESGAGDTILS